MADNLTPEQRSVRMSRIRAKDTTPELAVRKALHRLGFRFRLHRSDLPGSPDLVFPSRRKVVLVHGCFWHWHPDPCCPIAKVPKSRQDFWIGKLTRNRERDERTLASLEGLGWSPVTVWECQLRPKAQAMTIARIATFLGSVPNEEIQGRITVLGGDGP